MGDTGSKRPINFGTISHYVDMHIPGVIVMRPSLSLAMHHTITVLTQCVGDPKELQVLN